MRSPPTRPDDSPAKMPSFFASWEIRRSLFWSLRARGMAWATDFGTAGDRLDGQSRGRRRLRGHSCRCKVKAAISWRHRSQRGASRRRHIPPDPATGHGAVTERASSRQQP